MSEYKILDNQINEINMGNGMKFLCPGRVATTLTFDFIFLVIFI